MKKLLGTMKKKDNSPTETRRPFVLPQGDSPEAVVVREVSAFCESGAPGSQNSGEEYLHLPAIVDGAESSPAAAREAANTIRHFLSKDFYQRGYAQYNAIMLMRILTDNPARAFTQNVDTRFISTVKDLLREGRDTSVQQIMRETLDYFEAEKIQNNDTLTPLVEMWRKEKGKNARLQRPAGRGYAAQPLMQPRLPPRGPAGLPPPDELAGRIEEAKTTARLLLQTIQSTPQAELLSNELVKEFAERARTANQSIQTYMSCDNPAPDEDTMLTLIETNDQLNIAMSKHQRALLQARKAIGLSTPSPGPGSGHGQLVDTSETHTAPMPVHRPGQNVYSSMPQPDHGPYSSSPPNRSGAGLQPPLVPQHQETSFAPPPGPPPGARKPISNQPMSQEQTYQAYPGSNAPTQQVSHNVNSSADYGVGNNPFEDDAYAEAPPRQYSLFNRNNQTNLQPQEADSRPGGLPTTQSYLNRQDSAANHVTMHGGSPTRNNTDTQSSTYSRSNPVSPIDESTGVAQRMNDLRV